MSLFQTVCTFQEQPVQEDETRVAQQCVLSKVIFCPISFLKALPVLYFILCLHIFCFNRSKIAGLGLYATRDIERHTMVIEYIGEIIRSELSETREKKYQEKVGQSELLVEFSNVDSK